MAVQWGVRAACARRAYSFVNAKLLDSFDVQSRNEVIDVFTQALKLTWLVSIAFSALAFLLVFGEREIGLGTDLQTEYGLQDPTERHDVEEITNTGSDDSAGKQI